METRKEEKKETPYLRDSSANETRETYRKLMEETLNKQREREQETK